LALEKTDYRLFWGIIKILKKRPVGHFYYCIITIPWLFFELISQKIYDFIN
jgi:hypothetical protein